MSSNTNLVIEWTWKVHGPIEENDFALLYLQIFKAIQNTYS